MSEDSDIEERYGSLDDLDVSFDGFLYSAIFTLCWYFAGKHISFVELVAVMRINAFLF